MAEPIVRHGVSVCVFRDDAVLMIRRGKAPGIGLWAPVGGMIEPGETAAEAALRETLEETGVACRLIGVSGRRVIDRRDDGVAIRIVLTVHAAVWAAGDPVGASDATDARFVAMADLAGLELVDGVLPYITAARRLFDGQTA